MKLEDGCLISFLLIVCYCHVVAKQGNQVGNLKLRNFFNGETIYNVSSAVSSEAGGIIVRKVFGRFTRTLETFIDVGNCHAARQVHVSQETNKYCGARNVNTA